jgi:hypothetical protein
VCFFSLECDARGCDQSYGVSSRLQVTYKYIIGHCVSARAAIYNVCGGYVTEGELNNIHGIRSNVVVYGSVPYSVVMLQLRVLLGNKSLPCMDVMMDARQKVESSGNQIGVWAWPGHRASRPYATAARHASFA